MNNLLCSILFCLTAFNLVNADCSKHPEIKNAGFNREYQCGDVEIRCDKGFRMEQVTTCIDGEWKYQEPFCKPLECGYNFTNKTYVTFSHIEYISNLSLNQTECDQRCNENTECSTTFLSEDGTCVLYSAPLIFLALETDLDQCITKCTQMVDCLMLNHLGGNRCNLYNVSLKNLPEGVNVYENSDDYIVAEKFCL